MVSAVADDLSPMELMRALVTKEAEVGPGLTHLEMYTLEGLLGILWHGPRWAEAAVVLCGGGMGGFLGPAESIYPWLGQRLAEEGVATLRVDYRRPSHLEPCVLDACVAADLASQRGARSFVSVGHSFGGAVAINVALALPSYVRGVVTLASQSAGCESAAGLSGRPFLLVHGDADEILAPDNSFIVRELAGSGDVVVYPGAGHLLDQAADWMRGFLVPWILEALAGGRPAAPEPPPRLPPPAPPAPPASPALG